MVAAVYAGALAAALFATGSTAGAQVRSVETDGMFSPPSAFVKSDAVTYDQDLVPAASWIQVRQHVEPDGATTVELRVAGVKADHSFGVHVHQKACGSDPAAAGKHYQDKPGTDAAHVNDQNEVWLDFKSDAYGMGQATATHAWAFRKGEASSVVIHSAPGTTGARVACFTVPFGATS